MIVVARSSFVSHICLETVAIVIILLDNSTTNDFEPMASSKGKRNRN